MKKLVFILIFALILCFFVRGIWAKEKLPMKNKTIFLDAGHGGY